MIDKMDSTLPPHRALGLLKKQYSPAALGTVSQKEILPLQSQGVVDADSIRRDAYPAYPAF